MSPFVIKTPKIKNSYVCSKHCNDKLFLVSYIQSFGILGGKSEQFSSFYQLFYKFCLFFQKSPVQSSSKCLSTWYQRETNSKYTKNWYVLFDLIILVCMLFSINMFLSYKVIITQKNFVRHFITNYLQNKYYCQACFARY